MIDPSYILHKCSNTKLEEYARKVVAAASREDSWVAKGQGRVGAYFFSFTWVWCFYSSWTASVYHLLWSLHHPYGVDIKGAVTIFHGWGVKWIAQSHKIDEWWIWARNVIVGWLKTNTLNTWDMAWITDSRVVLTPLERSPTPRLLQGDGWCFWRLYLNPGKGLCLTQFLPLHLNLWLQNYVVSLI